MSQVMVDKYILGQSQSGQIANPAQEVRLDLQLQPVSINLGANINGKVVDANNTAIPNALVKLMDANYNPLKHAVTDSNGNYSFTNIPSSSSYSIFAIAAGTKLTQGTNFSLAQGQTVTKNFTLVADPAMQLAIIAGDLTQTGSSSTPINGAVVSLYSVTSGGDETLIAVTYSNQYGQFVFREIPIGNYVVRYSALGYVSTSTTTSVTNVGQIVFIKPTMVSNPNAALGTVSGVIKDSSNNPIDGADVILYKVNADSSLTPVAFTRTNSSGVYLFIYVPSGSYKVKSNDAEIINVNVTGAPDLNNLTLAQAATLVPVTSNGASGVLAGGATIDAPSGYAGYIGGPTDGSTTITVNVPLTGMYTLAVSHINSDGVRPLAVEVNGVGTGTIYDVPGTPGWTAADALIYNIDANLNQGDNTIKFHGNGTNYAPSIGPVSITIKPFTGSVNAANGVLAGGATIDAPSGYAGYIGGPTDGSTTITINAPLAGTYTLGVSHINSDGVRPLRVDVNGVGTGTTYDVPGTPGWNASDALIYNITVTLNQGNNSVKFHGNGTNYAPSLGPVSFTEVQYNYSLNAINATLGGSATVNGVFVTNIGGSGNGTVSMTTTVPYSGKYSFLLKYVSAITSNANVAVNGTDSGSSYMFTATSSLNLADAKIKVIDLTLNAGSNTITVK